MSDAEHYRATAFRAVRARQGYQLVTHLLTGERRLLPDSTVAVLDQAKAFLPLGAHETAAGQTFNTRAALEELRRRGLLISAEEFFRIAIPAERPAPVKLSTIGIPTRGSAALERCIRSYAAHAREWDRAVRFLIAGDAPEGGLRHRLAALAAELDIPLEYIGHSEKEAYAEALTKAGIDQDLVRFSLFGEAPGLPPGLARTTGANRNALLLAAAGEAFLSVDDDTVCRPVRSPSACDGLAFHSAGSPMEMWFDGGLPQDVEARVDLLAEMGLALGPAVAGPAPLDTSEFAHETMEKLLSGQGRALAVQVGLAGDAATMSPLGWLTSGGPTRERLVASESVYRGALASRRIFAAVRCRTVSSSDPLMTYALALDNRVLLPPFPPLGRDQDGVFGWVLRATEPLSFTGHLPFAIAHEPAEARFFPADAVARSFNGLLLNEAIRLALGEPASGAQLEETAALPPADFARVLTERRVASLSRAIVYLESVLTAARARPAYWARDMQLAIRQAERQMTSPDPLRFEEPGSACAQEDVRAACRRYIRLYAGLLRSWPEIRAVLRKD